MTALPVGPAGALGAALAAGAVGAAFGAVLAGGSFVAGALGSALAADSIAAGAFSVSDVAVVQPITAARTSAPIKAASLFRR